MSLPPDRIVIVGLGLIGGSLALAVRRRWPSATIVGIDRPGPLAHPVARNACSVLVTDVRHAGQADLVVLATPVEVSLELLPLLAPHLAANAVVTDVGSTKRAVIAAASDAGLPTFVGGHPMAGGATSGADNAREDLFDGRRWFLVTPADHEAYARVEAFVTALGAEPVEVTAELHDAGVAAGSHLPQVIASALMRVAGEALAPDNWHFGGAGLADTTRLASSPVSMWAGILATNADHLAPLLREMARGLDGIASTLHDRAQVEQFFEKAVQARADFTAAGRPP